MGAPAGEQPTNDGPRLSVIPGDFVDDRRATLIHYQVLTQLGRRTNKYGWCYINQKKLATTLGVARQTVCAAVSKLVEWGYVEKRGQKQTKRAICYYRVILDRGDPCAGPRGPSIDCGIGPVGDEDQDADVSPTDDTPVSAQDDTSPRGVSPTDDTRVASGDDTRVASRGDTLTKLYNDPPSLNEARAQARRGGEGESDLLEFLLERGLSPAVVTAFMEPVLAALTFNPRTPNPHRMLLEMGKELEAYSEPVLARTARSALRIRKLYMPSIPEVVAWAEAAKTAVAVEQQYQARRGTPEWAAWDAWWAKQMPTGRAPSWFRTHDVWVFESRWPPGHSPDGQPAPVGTGQSKGQEK